MNKQVILLVLVSIISAVLYLSYRLPKNEKEKIIKNHYTTIGVVSYIGNKNIDIDYVINHNTYSYRQSKPYKNIAIGEEFYTLVNKDDINSVLVDYTRPIIDTNKYDYAITNVVKINKLSIDKDELLFSYVVSNESYERIQKYSKGERPEELNTLKVKYRVDKPEVGYLVKD